MAVFKRTYGTGKTAWSFKFEHPSSTGEKRLLVRKSGFKQKKLAEDAEAEAKVKALAEHEAAKTRGVAAVPKSLADLLKEFELQCFKDLAAKTAEEYGEIPRYISPDLLGMRIAEIKPLHLHREWKRLSESGGIGKRLGRPLSPKTVRNIAGVISSAFVRAILWGLVDRNPVRDSSPPRSSRKEAITLSGAQHGLFLEAARLSPKISILLEVASATGARRGEVLALRWPDLLPGGRLEISRSLSQTRAGLSFKSTKTEQVRRVSLPASTIAILEEHRAKQRLHRRQFGSSYRTDLDLIICHENGEPIKPETIGRAVGKLAERLKLPKGASLHTLRHTHASQLLANGMEITAVSARLGHSSVNTTADIYSHVIEGRDADAAKLWELIHQRNIGTQNKEAN